MKAKKSLGQHFLRDRSALKRIAEAVEIEPGERVVEIGPGRGALTAELLAHGAKVTAVEKDEELVAELKESFASAIQENRLEVVAGDIQKLQPADYGLQTTDYKLAGNIPYYLTGAIIRKFLTSENQPSLAVLLVQKEVAERIATDSKESLLSISVKVYGEPRLAGVVKKGAFSPAPKVDSAILVVENISRDFFRDIDEVEFFTLLHAGFAEKRKQLLPKLRRWRPATDWERAFSKCGLGPKVRAEELEVEEWKCLIRRVDW